MHTENRSRFLVSRDLRDSLVKKYPEIADKLQYISCKIDRLTTVEKKELKAAGKEVPPTPVIPDSDDEEEDSVEEEQGEETECVDLTQGDDEMHEQAVAMPESTAPKTQEESKEEPKKSEAEVDQTIIVEETDQVA